VPAEYSRLIGDDIYLAGPHIPAATPAIAEAAALIPPPKIDESSPADPIELVKLAKSGKTQDCLDGLQKTAQAQGRGDYAYEPLEILLEQVKEDLRDAREPSDKVESAARTCESIISLLPECLSLDQPRTATIAAQAYNRRGDALLILGRPEDALKAFDAAQPLAPDDAYILYNRGRAYLSLGNQEAARADFTAAADPRFKQPKARKLATEALSALK
jgi:tetratricopeptide (TPR) repeat protein